MSTNGQTMLNTADVFNGDTSGLNITYPIWLNGFEVRLLDRHYALNKIPKNQNAYVRCVDKGAAFVGYYRVMQFEEGRNYCQIQTNGSPLDLPFVNTTNLYMFSVFTEKPFWIKDVDVGPFLHSEVLTAHCFVLLEFRDLQKDNCTNKYPSICANATVHDAIQYKGQQSSPPNYDPTSSSTHVTSSAANTPFFYNDSTSEPKTEEEANTSSIIIWISTTIGSCLVVLIVIIACLCLKRKHGNNTRTTVQQNELVLPSNVPQEDHDHHYDVIPDDITEREMTEKHPYTALAGPSFMSTERSSYVIGRIADNAVPVETQFQMTERQEKNYDKPENDGIRDTIYDDVKVSEKAGSRAEKYRIRGQMSN
ncbi:uncharacterized protein LOC127843000 isoform X2 [Dreissena polymorpha]|uniref:uncharacterized protein LOC127843000 isoform X2 n=1 Tax=Dreissena polymorpha TaxID=45954 RepID=UPI0022643961|nr:uncharacterized protein LOC127843000 isoform X2 [Dreissena polymorpha]